jgi:SAM-dependent methyltransferase
MSFEKYAKYYDALNAGKNYQSEIDYIHNLIQIKVPGARKILEIGCGTGKHASLLSNFGYEITCIDISGYMISIAKEANKNNPLLNFYHSDILDFKTEIKFDVVISLFHVVSYFTENSYILNAFRKVNTLINIGGYFIFDCWDGNGVLKDLPEIRYREFATQEILIHRISTPYIDFNKNIVDVNFKLKAIEDNDTINEFEENHKMRYFFPVEINLFSYLSSFRESSIKDNLFSTGWYSFYICEKLNDI